MTSACKRIYFFLSHKAAPTSTPNYVYCQRFYPCNYSLFARVFRVLMRKLFSIENPCAIMQKMEFPPLIIYWVFSYIYSYFLSLYTRNFRENIPSIFRDEHILQYLFCYFNLVQVEEGCQLNSADDIAGAVHHMLRIIEDETILGCQSQGCCSSIHQSKLSNLLMSIN